MCNFLDDDCNLLIFEDLSDKDFNLDDLFFDLSNYDFDSFRKDLSDFYDS